MARVDEKVDDLRGDVEEIKSDVKDITARPGKKVGQAGGGGDRGGRFRPGRQPPGSYSQVGAKIAGQGIGPVRLNAYALFSQWVFIHLTSSKICLADKVFLHSLNFGKTFVL